jgi:2-polyprenyl-3-methyl-5-hydroxy-6-metoxy-1,4-benzoquinol methylase
MRYDVLEELVCEADKYVALPPPPQEIVDNLLQARQKVSELASLAQKGSHGQYFDVSKERYAHYLAAATFLQEKSRILDVGNAPGHFAYLLSTMGHRVKGLNLSVAWRDTYPDHVWLDLFEVQEADIEVDGLPFPDRAFDALVFTEVLEHISVKNPRVILEDFSRVLVPGGLVIFSTPNVCNLSNVIALLLGKNIFWPANIFYGSLDRHNREYTPAEVDDLFLSSGFEKIALWGMCDHSNWRSGAAEFVYQNLSPLIDKSSMMRNTIVGLFRSKN